MPDCAFPGLSVLHFHHNISTFRLFDPSYTLSQIFYSRFHNTLSTSPSYIRLDNLLRPLPGRFYNNTSNDRSPSRFHHTPLRPLHCRCHDNTSKVLSSSRFHTPLQHLLCRIHHTLSKDLSSYKIIMIHYILQYTPF